MASPYGSCVCTASSYASSADSSPSASARSAAATGRVIWSRSPARSQNAPSCAVIVVGSGLRDQPHQPLSWSAALISLRSRSGSNGRGVSSGGGAAGRQGASAHSAGVRSIAAIRRKVRCAAVMKRFHVTTFGCQMNEHDSERMKGMLESLGYSEVPEREEADLILFNTCSIREKADERFVSHLYEARALKRRDPERVIGVGGCWAQSVKDQVFRDYPFVDVAFGPARCTSSPSS